jgi:ribosomal RNA-processing protein 36
LKEGDYKRLELVQRYEEIKERGGSVEKFLEKRRKKNAAREHRMMPYERRSAANDKK